MRRVALALAALALAGCRHDGDGEGGGAPATTGGDPERGAALIQEYGCGGCHTIPGIERADGRVGPHLGALGSSIAGRVETTPENLVRWITDPREIEPGTLMPDLGVDEAEARDIAAYLLDR